MNKIIFLLTIIYAILLTSEISAQEKITGPYRWALIPEIDACNESSFDLDFLKTRSNGAITEKTASTSEIVKSTPEVPWHYLSISPEGINNINEMLNTASHIDNKGNENSAVYGHLIIHSDEVQKSILRTGSDDSLKIWINGKLVHSFNSFRGASDYLEETPVILEKGNNIVLVRISNCIGSFSFFLGITGVFYAGEKKYSYSLNSDSKSFLNPKALNYMLKGRHFYSKNDIGKGSSYHQLAISSSPNDGVFNWAYSYDLFHAGLYDESNQQLQNALDKKYTKAHIYYFQGKNFLYLNQFDSAMESFNKCISISENNSFQTLCKLYLANLHTTLLDFKSAEKLISIDYYSQKSKIKKDLEKQLYSTDIGYVYPELEKDNQFDFLIFEIYFGLFFDSLNYFNKELSLAHLKKIESLLQMYSKEEVATHQYIKLYQLAKQIIQPNTDKKNAIEILNIYSIYFQKNIATPQLHFENKILLLNKSISIVLEKLVNQKAHFSIRQTNVVSDLNPHDPLQMINGMDPYLNSQDLNHINQSDIVQIISTKKFNKKLTEIKIPIIQYLPDTIDKPLIHLNLEEPTFKILLDYYELIHSKIADFKKKDVTPAKSNKENQIKLQNQIYTSFVESPTNEKKKLLTQLQYAYVESFQFPEASWNFFHKLNTTYPNFPDITLYLHALSCWHTNKIGTFPKEASTYLSVSSKTIVNALNLCLYLPPKMKQMKKEPIFSFINLIEQHDSIRPHIPEIKEHVRKNRIDQIKKILALPELKIQPIFRDNK